MDSDEAESTSANTSTADAPVQLPETAEREASSPPDEPLPDTAGAWVAAERPDIARSFKELRLSDGIKKAVAEMGFEKPTPVQGAVYQPIVDGYDLIVQSHTGSGKTVAYGLPLAELLNPELNAIQALVLCPTRELAAQVSDELDTLYRYVRLRTTAIYGGAAMGPQLDKLRRGVHVVVGTPGRVLDHIRRKTLDASRLRVLVFDEADEMLSMGFAKEVDAIVEALPRKRQGQLFSATIPDEIRALGRRSLREPDLISLSDDFIAAEQITHVYYLVDGMNKPKQLTQIIEAEKPESALVFCNTREDTSFVAAYLRRQGYDSEAISGDYSQRERERVMTALKEKRLRFLVATDVAARGIDVRLLSHVMNYDLPESPEMYIHRTGRTGRAGTQGIAISVVSPRNIGDLALIKKIYKLRMEERPMPDPTEIRQQRTEERLTELRNSCAGAPAANGDEKHLVEAIVGAQDAKELVLGLLRRAEARPADTQQREAPDSRRRESRRDARDGGRSRRDSRDGGRSRRDSRDGGRPRSDSRDGGRSRRDSRDGGRSRRDSRDGGRSRRDSRDGGRSRSDARERSDNSTSLADEYRSAPKEDDAATRKLAARAARGEYGDEQEQARAAPPAGDAADPARRRRRRRRRSGTGKENAAESEEVWSKVDESPADDDGSPADGEKPRRMSTVSVNLGRTDDVRASEVARIVRDLSGLGRHDLGRVQVRESVTHLSVRADVADNLVQALEGKDYKGKPLSAERVR